MKNYFILLLSVSSLFAIETFECKFDKASIDGKIDETVFKMNFIIDGENTYVIGNNGSSKVALFKGLYGGNSFIEITNGNYVIITTVDEKLKAVHSRHSIINGKLFPQQYYGVCEIK